MGTSKLGGVFATYESRLLDAMEQLLALRESVVGVEEREGPLDGPCEPCEPCEPCGPGGPYGAWRGA